MFLAFLILLALFFVQDFTQTTFLLSNSLTTALPPPQAESGSIIDASITLSMALLPLILTLLLLYVYTSTAPTEM